MKRTLIALGVSGAAVLGASVFSCSSITKSLVQEPKVELSRVGIKDVGPGGATILIGVQVANPNAFELKVDSLKYNLEVGGKALGAGEIKDPVRVAGHATNIVDIPVTVRFEDLFSSALDFLQKSSTSYRVTGEAKSGFLSVPFDRTGEMKLK